MPTKNVGFSFLEVLIALLLISLGAFSLIQLQIDIERQSEFALDSSQALQLAENKLEWFRTRGAKAQYSTLEVADFSHDMVAGEEQLPPYLLQWNVETMEPDGTLKLLHIEVSWLDRLAEKRKVELDTLISQHSEFDSVVRPND